MDIYVGNLPYKASDSDLRQLFESYGQVTSARVIMDKFSGQSKGFGFVEMPDRTAAMNAIEQTNGQDLDGRKLRVNESRPREDRPPRGDDRGPRGDRGPRRDEGRGYR
jgi:RNA recognition motif-containing protein